MRYRNAAKLHNEDEVIRKSDSASLYVISTVVNTLDKSVIILCDDGNAYHHRDVK